MSVEKATAVNRDSQGFPGGIGVGEDLIRKVASATGLPQDLIDEELLRLLRQAGVDSARLTLEDLRTILADYVQDVLVAAKESTDPSP